MLYIRDVEDMVHLVSNQAMRWVSLGLKKDRDKKNKDKLEIK